MTDETRKTLIIYIGEKFHKVIQKGTCSRCSCGERFGAYSMENLKHISRTFTTPDDMAAVRKAIIDKGEWSKFRSYVYNRWLHDVHDETSYALEGESFTTAFERWLTNAETFNRVAGQAVEAGVIGK